MDDLVELNDVLYAMADSLMEKQPKVFKPILKFQDTKVTFKIGGKPPREVFYRNTSTFITQLPPMIPFKPCSCKYLCTGSPAIILCHSCSLYYPENTAWYCQACFE